MQMAKAQCSCGAVSVTLPEPSSVIIACHCLECQRQSGAPFRVGAYYQAEAVTVRGDAKEYAREAGDGRKFRSYFCTTCGSTVYWKADKIAGMIGVAVGCMDNPNFPPPARSVFEQSKHHWVQLDAAGAHFAQGSVRASS
jgi:hypothetical protein